jgi:lysophospholipase L1-like esterase
VGAHVAALGLLLGTSALAGCGSDTDDELNVSNEELRPRASYASWAAAPQAYDELLPFPGAPPPEPQQFADQSIRQVVRLSAGGDMLRVRLSNLFGAEPLGVSALGVARSLGGAEIDAASQVAVTFGGESGVTLAPFEELWSDFVPLAVAAEAELALTLYLADSTPVSTLHSLGQQTAYVAPGNAVAASTLPSDDTRTSYYFLTGIDVGSVQVGSVQVGSVEARRVLVAFGDSITDGFGSTLDAQRRYPNVLSARLTEDAGALAPYSVVNAGISGNRVLNDVIGPAGVSRFGRDALGQTGVSSVLLLLGINDIGFSGFVPEQEVSADQITAGLSSLVEAAEAEGVEVILGTLLPFKGVMPPYYSEAAELKRQAVNAWIRANTRASGVVDFDQAMQDEVDPLTLAPEYDSGDHLHPNDLGYEAMANAIDLALLE